MRIGRAAVYRQVVILAGILCLLVMGASFASAQDLPQPDGRINQVAHFGGDAFYCVDENLVSTSSYPVVVSVGGMRLLDSNGQELWMIPAEIIAAAVEEAEDTGKGVLVATGRGSFGPANLYVYVLEDVPYFVLSGYDEYGKPNSLEFTFCTPVGPGPEVPGDGSGSPDCIEIVPPPKRMVGIIGGGSELPPCDEPIDPCVAGKSIGFGDALKGTPDNNFIPCCDRKLARVDLLGKAITLDVSGTSVDPCTF